MTSGARSQTGTFDDWIKCPSLPKSAWSASPPRHRWPKGVAMTCSPENMEGGRVHLTNGDCLFLVQLYRWFPSVLKSITIIQLETLVRWQRAGFRRYWRWKSRSLGGRPQLDADLRALIRRMSVDNPLWGAPRIHGELLKLGFEVAQSSVAR
jgi:hypothetical protein